MDSSILLTIRKEDRVMEIHLSADGHEQEGPSREELRNLYLFTLGQGSHASIPPEERDTTKGRYMLAYKVLMTLVPEGSAVEPTPRSPEELPNPTEKDLAELEATVGVYIFAVGETARAMANVFLF